MILVHQVLSLLRLVFKLACQLNVLDNRQLSRANKLVLVHVEHLDLDCPDLHQHLLSECIDLLYLLLFDLVDNFGVRLSLPIQLKLPLMLEIVEPILKYRLVLLEV